MNAKITLPCLAALVSLAATAAAQKPAAAADHHAMPQSRAFSQLGALVGAWEGTAPDGQTISLSFELASGGTALIERMTMGTEPEMVTVYHPDGDRVAVTHYCSAGNQPQMRTGPISGSPKEFSFAFVRAANLASPAAGHMHHLTVTLVDRDHLTEEWTWQENGQAQAQVFRFARKN
jgi:hypothetical protein